MTEITYPLMEPLYHTQYNTQLVRGGKKDPVEFPPDDPPIEPPPEPSACNPFSFDIDLNGFYFTIPNDPTTDPARIFSFLKYRINDTVYINALPAMDQWEFNPWNGSNQAQILLFLKVFMKSGYEYMDSNGSPKEYEQNNYQVPETFFNSIRTYDGVLYYRVRNHTLDHLSQLSRWMNITLTNSDHELASIEGISSIHIEGLSGKNIDTWLSNCNNNSVPFSYDSTEFLLDNVFTNTPFPDVVPSDETATIQFLPMTQDDYLYYFNNVLGMTDYPNDKTVYGDKGQEFSIYELDWLSVLNLPDGHLQSCMTAKPIVDVLAMPSNDGRTMAHTAQWLLTATSELGDIDSIEWHFLQENYKWDLNTMGVLSAPITDVVIDINYLQMINANPINVMPYRNISLGWFPVNRYIAAMVTMNGITYMSNTAMFVSGRILGAT